MMLWSWTCFLAMFFSSTVMSSFTRDAWMWNVPISSWVCVLNTCSLPGKGYGTFRRWCLEGESMSLGWAFNSCLCAPHSFPSALGCRYNVTSRFHASATVSSLPWWLYPSQNCRQNIPFLPSIAFVGVVYHFDLSKTNRMFAAWLQGAHAWTTISIPCYPHPLVTNKAFYEKKKTLKGDVAFSRLILSSSS